MAVETSAEMTAATSAAYNSKTRNIATNSDLMTKSEHDGIQQASDRDFQRKMTANSS